MNAQQNELEHQGTKRIHGTEKTGQGQRLRGWEALDAQLQHWQQEQRAEQCFTTLRENASNLECMIRPNSSRECKEQSSHFPTGKISTHFLPMYPSFLGVMQQGFQKNVKETQDGTLQMAWRVSSVPGRREDMVRL